MTGEAPVPCLQTVELAQHYSWVCSATCNRYWQSTVVNVDVLTEHKLCNTICQHVWANFQLQQGTGTGNTASDTYSEISYSFHRFQLLSKCTEITKQSEDVCTVQLTWCCQCHFESLCNLSAIPYSIFVVDITNNTLHTFTKIWSQ